MIEILLLSDKVEVFTKKKKGHELVITLIFSQAFCFIDGGEVIYFECNLSAAHNYNSLMKCLKKKPFEAPMLELKRQDALNASQG